jgi:hypothetical protein
MNPAGHGRPGDAMPAYLRAWICCALLAAAGRDFIGGAFFEHAFAWLLAPAFVIVPAVLAFASFGLVLALLGGRGGRP